MIAKVEELKRKHEESVSEKNALREEAEMLEMKLDRANKLVTGLSGYVIVQRSCAHENTCNPCVCAAKRSVGKPVS